MWIESPPHQGGFTPRLVNGTTPEVERYVEFEARGLLSAIKAFLGKGR